jgi:CubicO group peptidase (beta-lactamase class C family)
MQVVTSRHDVSSTPGQYGWDGGLGTSWRADPREEMTAILLTPKPWDSPSPPNVFRDFWTTAYSAIDD